MAIYILGPDSDGNCCTCEERVNVCDTCVPVTGCACGLLIPPVDDIETSPYADYATAAAVIAAQVASCIGYVQRKESSLITSFTADDSVANELTLTVVGNPDGTPTCQTRMCASLNMKASSTLTVVSTAVGGLLGGLLGGGGKLYSCDGTLLDTQSGSPVTFSIPSDGEYLFAAGITSSIGTSDTMTSVITSDDAMTVNPVIALWDDSGTTRQLEACPKMYLPPLTESTGDWYADEAIAAAVLASSKVSSNCLSYTGTTPTSFSSSSSGTISETTTQDEFGFYYSPNLVGGSTFSIGYNRSCSGGASGTGLNRYQVIAILYDDTGSSVQSVTGLQDSGSSSSGTLTFTTLPNTGRYIIAVSLAHPVSQGAPATSATLSITTNSSGSVSLNPIQALYDVGLECAARLLCS